MDSSSEHSTRKDDYSISPPTYRVVEDELGDLFNPELKVKYPERPKKGRYSLTSYLRARKKGKRAKECTYSEDESAKLKKQSRRSVFKSTTKKSTSKSLKCRCKCGRCCCQEGVPGRLPHDDHDHRRRLKPMNHAKIPLAISLDALISERNQRSSEEDYEEIDQPRQAQVKRFTRAPKLSLSSLSLREQNHKRNRVPSANSLKEMAVGPQTPKVVAKMLSPTQFLLYYRRADPIESIDDVPISESLTMAFKSSDNRVFHYKVRHNRKKKYWHVEGMKNRREFQTLDRLIQYYKEFRTVSGDIA